MPKDFSRNHYMMLLSRKCSIPVLPQSNMATGGNLPHAIVNASVWKHTSCRDRHTHRHTHTQTQTHTHTCQGTLKRTDTHTRTHMHTHMPTCACEHEHARPVHVRRPHLLDDNVFVLNVMRGLHDPFYFPTLPGEACWARPRGKLWR